LTEHAVLLGHKAAAQAFGGGHVERHDEDGQTSGHGHGHGQLDQGETALALVQPPAGRVV